MQFWAVIKGDLDRPSGSLSVDLITTDRFEAARRRDRLVGTGEKGFNAVWITKFSLVGPTALPAPKPVHRRAKSHSNPPGKK